MNAKVSLSWRWIAEKNPHADKDYIENPVVPPGLVRVYLNDREIPADRLRMMAAPDGEIPSRFVLKNHEIIEVKMAGCELRNGENNLAFEMPKFPDEHDPYVYVYEVTVDVSFADQEPITSSQ